MQREATGGPSAAHNADANTNNAAYEQQQ